MRAYSLGMRQRLGLAAALLRRPSMLILDEPTNGLDPRGIREIRDLLIELNAARATNILLSSHLLGEVEQLCTRIGVLDRGTPSVIPGRAGRAARARPTASCCDTSRTPTGPTALLGRHLLDRRRRPARHARRRSRRSSTLGSSGRGCVSRNSYVSVGRWKTWSSRRPGRAPIGWSRRREGAGAGRAADSVESDSAEQVAPQAPAREEEAQ